MFFRSISTVLTTDFKVRVVLNPEAVALSALGNYEPLLTSISLPSAPVSFSRMGVSIGASYTEPTFSFAYIPAKTSLTLPETIEEGDPLIMLEKVQYSKDGLLIPRGSSYVTDEPYSTETALTGVYCNETLLAERTFQIKIGFDVFNVINGSVLYQFRNCRFNVMQASAAVSGEELVSYNVNVFADSLKY